MNHDSRILIDSNVLIYSVEPSSPEKHDIAMKLILQQCQSKTGTVSCQNLAEFMYVLQRRYKNSLEDGAKFLRGASANFNIIVYTDEDVLRAWHLTAQYNLPFFDALLVATMEKVGISTIITENEKDFKKIPWLTVINPF